MTEGSPGAAEAVAPGRFNALTDVEGIEVGHCTLDGAGALTGVTAVLTGGGAVGAVDVRGAAPATREVEALRPENLVGEVHAVVLSGSSAFGLGAADGVMQYLAERHVGYRVGAAPHEVVPVVPAAAVFDLGRGGEFAARAGRDEGYRAAEAARGGPLPEGSVGAGTGALFAGRRLKGGVGTASATCPGGTVAALVVLNALGSALDPSSGSLYGAGSLLPGEAEQLGLAGTPSGEELASWLAAAPDSPSAGAQTVIGVVATDVELSRGEARRMATLAHDGLARAVRPAHTSFDGDAFFALSTGRRQVQAAREAPARQAALVELLELGAGCVTRAIVHAVLAAGSRGRWRSYSDCFPSALAR